MSSATMTTKFGLRGAAMSAAAPEEGDGQSSVKSEPMR